MSDVHDAAAPADGALSVSDAARMLSNSRRQAPPESMPDPERDDDVAADEPAYESFEADEVSDAAPDDDRPSGDDEGDDPAEPPPSIEPPRSWTKQAKEHFAALPPETQQFLLDQDRSREREVRKSQNEAAEARKTVDARVQAAEQQRQQYEALLPQVHQVLLGQHFEQFADVQTHADLARMAREDPFRFGEYQVSERKVQAAFQEMQQAQQRQSQEFQTKWQEFAAEQDRLTAEKAPEFADPTKAAKAEQAAVSYLNDIGLSREEIGNLWNGNGGISLRDHRLRLIIRDAARYHAAKSATKTASSKAVPPVQRPGTAPARNNAASEIQALEKAFERNPSAKNGAALTAAKRRAATRPRQ